MYKFPDVPSPKADVHEIADFIEIECIRHKRVSARDVSASLNILVDYDYRINGVPEEEELEPKIVESLHEIEQRQRFCGNRYPFSVSQHGYVVTFNPMIDEIIREVYTFLLFTTRLDMQKERIQNNIDGALLFEELSEYTGKNYFGERAESFLFGTASRGSNFRDKIKSLVQRMKEGRGFESRSDSSPNINKDDNLDVVVWKSFSDGYPGKLIGFGQCKTGTYWENSLTSLQPDSFCKKWFRNQPAVNPIRLYFISESILRTDWYNHTSEAGILFDRCRIMDYLPIYESLPFFPQIKTWNRAVAEKFLLR